MLRSGAQVVRHRVGERVELLIGGEELRRVAPQRLIALLELMRALGHPLLELRGVAPQLLLARLDPAEHLVECVGQHAQFVLADLGRPHGVVLPSGDRPGGFRQGENGLRDPSLQDRGQDVSSQQRDRHHPRGDGGRKAQGAGHGLQVGLQVQRAQTLTPHLRYRLDADQIPVREAVAVSLWSGRKTVAGEVPRIAREQPAVRVVQARRHDMRLGSQRGQDFPRVGFVGESQRGGAVRGDDAPQRGQVLRCRLPERRDLVRHKRRGRQQQHQAADQEEHGRQLPLDRPVAQRHLNAPRG